MLTLSSCNFLNAATRHGRYHPRKVKEGIGGFKMTPIQQRRSMFWFAARTVWMVTKTAGGLILTRTAGDRLRAVKNLIITKPSEAGLKPATNYITSYFAQKAIPNGPTKLRNALFNVARITYGTVLSFLTYLTIELYNVGHVLVGEISKCLIVIFNFGKELLIRLTGPLSDAMMVAYTGFYLFALAFLIYIAFRLVHHILYNLFSFRSLMRTIVDTITTQAEEEQKVNSDKFYDEVKKFFDRSAIGGNLTLERNNDGSITLREAKFEESYLGQQIVETKKLEEEYQKQNLIVSTNKKKK